MSYNGIGLASVRGSGTSGYVTTNKFHLKGSRLGPRDSHRDRDDAPGASRKPNQEILEHNRKRAVEVKLLVLRDSLEEKGCVGSTLTQRFWHRRRAAPWLAPCTLLAHGRPRGSLTRRTRAQAERGGD